MKRKYNFRDNAQASENKGKITKVCAYRAQRLASVGVEQEDYVRAAFPIGQRFSYETLTDTSISITPVKDLPYPEMHKAIYKALDRGLIVPSGCFMNAVYIARFLKNLGISGVRCVEGYYKTRYGWFLHRFNEYNGLYFDATGEFFSSTPLTEIEYRPVRIYTAQELLVYSVACSLEKDRCYNQYYCTSLPHKSQYDNPLDDGYDVFYLDDEGLFCKQDKTIDIKA